ncbi:Ig-like domain-containing protein [Neorhodopirellula pilleata]|uniref:Cadherin domain protein n=1 Tax=Neorhodopirellula pilleata TaxID=2714738 RepID=A0A5C6AHL3_9BACT|nr:Ig-like domain-containing protein [Neorhodopirellula pilleata]TWT98957.1 Cadherin domain protein [Neorhodopirellula pilleata]
MFNQSGTVVPTVRKSGTRHHGGDHRASAPVKAIELSGESPDRGNRYRPVANGNCVFNRKGGEQPKANEFEAGGDANTTPGIDPTGNVLDNDTDLDVTDSANVVGVAQGITGAASGFVGAPVDGLYGNITIQSNGLYVYNVDNNHPDVEALRTTTDTLEDVFTYTIVDGQGAQSTQQITITIQGANDDPFDLTTTDLTIDENLADGQLVGVVTPSDIDADEDLFYQLTDDADGRFAIDHSGNITVLDSSRLDFEDADQHQISVRVTDQSGGQYEETFTVYLNDVDEFDVTVPVDVDLNTNEINENSVGAPVGITVSAFDGDGTNSLVTYALTDDADGRFSIDQSSGIVTTLVGLNFEAQSSHLIEVLATSQDGSTSTQVFTINVLDVNEAPVALNDTYDTLASQSKSLTTPEPTANDTDVDGDELEMVIVTQPSNGTLTIAADGSLIYTPNTGFFGTDSFTYRAHDGFLDSNNTATVSIAVQAGNPGGGGGSGGGGDTGGGTGDSGSGDGDGNSGTGSSGGNDDVLGDSTGDIDEGTNGGDLPGGHTQERDSSDQAKAKSTQSSQDDDSVYANGWVGADPDARDSSDKSVSSHGLGRGYRFWNGPLSFEINFTQISLGSLASDELFRADQDSLFAWYVVADADDLIKGKDEDEEVLIGAVGTTLGLASIGYVLWALRGGMLVATMYAGIPTWRMLDPATLINAYRDDGTAKDRVEELLDKRKDA